MKRIITAIIVLLCLTIALIMPDVKAAGSIYFTAIMNELQPLKSGTMPMSINGLLYIPYTFFSSEKLGVYFLTGTDKVLLYSAAGSKQLTFDVVRSTVFDQDQNQYYIPAQRINGLIYVPVDSVCEFFGLNYSTIICEPAPIIRFLKGTSPFNDPTFASINRTKMLEYYTAYTGTPVSPGASSSPSSSPAPTYENVTVYLSYYDLAPDGFAKVLDALNVSRYKCCFFLSVGEIAADAELIRRAAGAGHSIGIWLADGTFGEYQEASALLFEAAKIRTLLVSAYGDAAETAAATADSKGLVFWSVSRTYDASSKLTLAGVTGNLTVLSGNRESVNFACTDKAASLAGSFFSYLADKKYSVRRITERTLLIPYLD
jgi:hypothetical protein